MVKILNFLIQSNIWVAVNSCALYCYFMSITGNEINTSYLFFIFFSCILVYGLQRFYRILAKEDNPDLKQLFNILGKSIVIIWLCSKLGILILVAFIPCQKILLLFFALIVSILYVYNPFGRPIRETMSLAKAFIIALVWTWVLFFVPLGWSQLQIQLYGFILISGYCLPFDLRDINIDQANGIKTIAHKMDRTHILALSMALIMASFIGFISNTQATVFTLIIPFTYTLLVLIRINNKGTKNDYNLLLESLPLILLFSHLALNI